MFQNFSDEPYIKVESTAQVTPSWPKHVKLAPLGVAPGSQTLQRKTLDRAPKGILDTF